MSFKHVGNKIWLALEALSHLPASMPCALGSAQTTTGVGSAKLKSHFILVPSDAPLEGRRCQLPNANTNTWDFSPGGHQGYVQRRPSSSIWFAHLDRIGISERMLISIALSSLTHIFAGRLGSTGDSSRQKDAFHIWGPYVHGKPCSRIMYCDLRSCNYMQCSPSSRICNLAFCRVPYAVFSPSVPDSRCRNAGPS